VAELTAAAMGAAREAAAQAGVSLDTGARSITKIITDSPELSAFVGGSNKIIGGVTLFLSRREQQPGCGGKFDKLHAPCADGAKRSNAPFGVDPVASPFHDMFDPAVAEQLGAFYNATDGSSDLHSRQGLPDIARHVIQRI